MRPHTPVHRTRGARDDLRRPRAHRRRHALQSVHGQEPGTADEIATFCSTTYGVTFPLLEKADVKGDDQHPLYSALTQAADARGEAGDVQWNFEKFLVDADGTVVNRFRPRTEPNDPAVISAIEAVL